MMTPSTQIAERKVHLAKQVEQLTAELNDIEAAERVWAKYGMPAQAANGSNPPARRRGRPPRASTESEHSNGAEQSTSQGETSDGEGQAESLSKRVLALATGRTRAEIGTTLAPARPNHIAIAIKRHLVAGRIEERDGKLYAHATA